MKILFIGDFKSKSAPAIVNRDIRNFFKEDIGLESRFSEENGYKSRVLEIIKKGKDVDIICFLGLSKLNLLGMFFCKLKKKNVCI